MGAATSGAAPDRAACRPAATKPRGGDGGGSGGAALAAPAAPLHDRGAELKARLLKGELSFKLYKVLLAEAMADTKSRDAVKRAADGSTETDARCLPPPAEMSPINARGDSLPRSPSSPRRFATSPAQRTLVTLSAASAAGSGANAEAHLKQRLLAGEISFKLFKVLRAELQSSTPPCQEQQRGQHYTPSHSCAENRVGSSTKAAPRRGVAASTSSPHDPGRSRSAADCASKEVPGGGAGTQAANSRECDDGAGGPGSAHACDTATAEREHSEPGGWHTGPTAATISGSEMACPVDGAPASAVMASATISHIARTTAPLSPPVEAEQKVHLAVEGDRERASSQQHAHSQTTKPIHR